MPAVDLTKDEQIARSLSRYRLLERATRYAFWEWDIRTDEVWWNDVHFELSGYGPACMKPSFQAWADCVHPEDRVRVLGKFDAILASGATTYRDEYRYRPSNGRCLVVDDCGYIERDPDGRPIRMLGAMRDVTEEREAARALRESEERFRQITETIRDVFWLTDLANGRVLYVSPAFEAIWGRSVEALTTERFGFLDGVHADDRPRMHERVQRLIAGEGYEESYRVVRPDGTTVWVHDRATVIRDAEGKPVRATGIAADVTAQRHLEEQLSMAQKMESLGRLASGVAHDFNNLLGVILACAELAREKVPGRSEVQAEIEAVLGASRRAAELTAQLLAFARNKPRTTTTFDLGELIRRFEPLARLLAGRSIAVEFHLDPSASPITADATQMEQVLANLTVNARDAMPEGGRLRVETANVSIEGAEYVRMLVRDTGTGIPVDLRGRIFEPFFTTKRPGEGTGLGLAICYRIVQEAGGQIAVVDDEEGSGTTIQVLLRRAAS